MPTNVKHSITSLVLLIGVTWFDYFDVTGLSRIRLSATFTQQ